MKKILGFTLGLTLALTLLGCDARKAEVLLKDASNSTQSFERIVRAGQASGLITNDVEVKLLLLDKKLVLEDDAAADAALHQGQAQDAIGHIDAALADIDAAIAGDLLGVKNETKQAELHAVLLSLRTTLVVAKSLLTK